MTLCEFLKKLNVEIFEQQIENECIITFHVPKSKSDICENKLRKLIGIVFL